MPLDPDAVLNAEEKRLVCAGNLASAIEALRVRLHLDGLLASRIVLGWRPPVAEAKEAK